MALAERFLPGNEHGAERIDTVTFETHFCVLELGRRAANPVLDFTQFLDGQPGH